MNFTYNLIERSTFYLYHNYVNNKFYYKKKSKYLKVLVSADPAISAFDNQTTQKRGKSDLTIGVCKSKETSHSKGKTGQTTETRAKKHVRNDEESSKKKKTSRNEVSFFLMEEFMRTILPFIQFFGGWK